MFRSIRLLIEDNNDTLEVFRELFLRFFLLCGDFVIVYGSCITSWSLVTPKAADASMPVRYVCMLIFLGSLLQWFLSVVLEFARWQSMLKEREFLNRMDLCFYDINSTLLMLFGFILPLLVMINETDYNEVVNNSSFNLGRVTVYMGVMLISVVCNICSALHQLHPFLYPLLIVITWSIGSSFTGSKPLTSLNYFLECSSDLSLSSSSFTMDLGDCLLRSGHRNNATLGYGLALLFGLIILAIYSFMYLFDPRVSEHRNMTVKAKIRKDPSVQRRYRVETFFNFFLAVPQRVIIFYFYTWFTIVTIVLLLPAFFMKEESKDDDNEKDEVQGSRLSVIKKDIEANKTKSDEEEDEKTELSFSVRIMTTLLYYFVYDPLAVRQAALNDLNYWYKSCWRCLRGKGLNNDHYSDSSDDERGTSPMYRNHRDYDENDEKSDVFKDSEKFAKERKSQIEFDKRRSTTQYQNKDRRSVNAPRSADSFMMSDRDAVHRTNLSVRAAEQELKEFEKDHQSRERLRSYEEIDDLIAPLRSPHRTNRSSASMSGTDGRNSQYNMTSQRKFALQQIEESKKLEEEEEHQRQLKMILNQKDPNLVEPKKQSSLYQPRPSNRGLTSDRFFDQFNPDGAYLPSELDSDDDSSYFQVMSKDNQTPLNLNDYDSKNGYINMSNRTRSSRSGSVGMSIDDSGPILDDYIYDDNSIQNTNTGAYLSPSKYVMSSVLSILHDDTKTIPLKIRQLKNLDLPDHEFQESKKFLLKMSKSKASINSINSDIQRSQERQSISLQSSPNNATTLPSPQRGSLSQGRSGSIMNYPSPSQNLYSGARGTPFDQPLTSPQATFQYQQQNRGRASSVELPAGYGIPRRSTQVVQQYQEQHRPRASSVELPPGYNHTPRLSSAEMGGGEQRRSKPQRSVRNRASSVDQTLSPTDAVTSPYEYQKQQQKQFRQQQRARAASVDAARMEQLQEQQQQNIELQRQKQQQDQMEAYALQQQQKLKEQSNRRMSRVDFSKEFHEEQEKQSTTQLSSPMQRAEQGGLDQRSPNHTSAPLTPSLTSPSVTSTAVTPPPMVLDMRSQEEKRDETRRRVSTLDIADAFAQHQDQQEQQKRMSQIASPQHPVSGGKGGKGAVSPNPRKIRISQYEEDKEVVKESDGGGGDKAQSSREVSPARALKSPTAAPIEVRAKSPASQLKGRQSPTRGKSPKKPVKPKFTPKRFTITSPTATAETDDI